MGFTHLHLHTEYSMLDGANKIKELAQRLTMLGMDSVAMTDHGNMFGALDFYINMIEYGIKPIIGIETYIHNDEDENSKNPLRFHLCLFAKNEIGYQNLMYLSSQAYLKGFFRHARINKKLLKAHSEGLICSSACLQGEVNYHLNTKSRKNTEAKGYARALEVALEYKEIFGEDFYLEIMRHGIPDQKFIEKNLIKLSLESGIKLIATNDAHYGTREDASKQDILMCIGMGKTIEDKSRLHHSVNEFYVKDSAQMERLFSDIPEVLANTQEIANKCNLILNLKNIDLVKNSAFSVSGEKEKKMIDMFGSKLWEQLKNRPREHVISKKDNKPTPPSFKFTKQYAQKEGLEYEDDNSYFFHRCKIGLKERLSKIDSSLHEIYQQRLDEEMKIIANLNFSGYMLIVWDFVREAKEKEIPVGPGRGSAAGSLVAYCLNITDIDPIKYNLLFERFLNAERATMPDIDMDFCQSRRDEIIDYVINVYGKYNVAHVITFSSLLAKGVIRDVARVLDVPYKIADDFAKLIPNILKISLFEAYQQESRIKQMIEEDSQKNGKNAKLNKVWDISIKLENQKRNPGTHAAAIVIDSQKELWHKVPLCLIKDKITTQYANTKGEMEFVDLVKFDFLGLKTLTVVHETKQLIKHNYNVELDFQSVDVNDINVYKILQSGNTNGIFQIESGMMKGLNRSIKPTNFGDISALIAIGRPGPLGAGFDKMYADRKHGREEIKYYFKELEPFLKETYGCIIYQEQVMQIVQLIGGFSLGKADLIRRAMGKKNSEEFANYKKEYLEGAKKNGFDAKISEELWKDIANFAEYGFNRSHSVAYAMLVFQTAFLKTYYKHEFMAALLTGENKVDKINLYIQECRNMGIVVLPPHVNYSQHNFDVVTIDGEKKIVFGFCAIKSIGHNSIQIILNERKKGEFKDLTDFFNRIDDGAINKRVLEALAKAGAFKNLGFSIKSIMKNVDFLADIIRTNAKHSKENDLQDSLFKDLEIEKSKVELNIENLAEYSNKVLYDYEYETLGIFMSGNPMLDWEHEINSINGVVYSHQINDLETGSNLLIIGILRDIKERISKKSGRKYGEAMIVDKFGEISITIFEREIEQLKNVSKDEPICLKCSAQSRINSENDTINLKIDKILNLKDAKKEKVEPRWSNKDEENIVEINPYYLQLSEDIEFSTLKQIQNLAIENYGSQPLIVSVVIRGESYLLFSSYKINDDFKQKVSALIA